MALACDSHKAESPTAKLLTGVPQVKLVELTDQDDIEAYLVTFKRIMQAYIISEEQWTYYLALQLTGKAQQTLLSCPSMNPKPMTE